MFYKLINQIIQGLGFMHLVEWGGGHYGFKAKRIEYKLEWNSIEKSVKRPFCCTVSIL